MSDALRRTAIAKAFVLDLTERGVEKITDPAVEYHLAMLLSPEGHPRIERRIVELGAQLPPFEFVPGARVYEANYPNRNGTLVEKNGEHRWRVELHAGASPPYPRDDEDPFVEHDEKDLRPFPR